MEVRKALKKVSNKDYAIQSQRFFKTGPGQYGEGDIFIGTRVPDIRSVAKQYQDLSFRDTTTLLKSKIHEERLLALLILVIKFQSAGSSKEEKEIYSFYIDHFEYVNNWDLVDLSAPKIVGAYLLKNNKKIPTKWIKSNHLWTRRISMVSTLKFIQEGELDEAYRVAQCLLAEEHDLMHKAVGWMLREAGKKDETRLKKFLKTNIKKMARTTLRYSIERFEETERKSFLML